MVSAILERKFITKESFGIKTLDNVKLKVEAGEIYVQTGEKERGSPL